MVTEVARSPTPEAHRPEPTPEEQAMVFTIHIFIRMRWIAIAGIVIATISATSLFRIGFSALPVYIICALMAMYNLVLSWQARGLRPGISSQQPEKEPLASLVERARAMSNIHIGLDVITLAVLLHFTGGVENPFIFYFVFHVIIAGTLLYYRVAYVFATLTILLVALLVGLEYFGAIPHVHLEGFTSPDVYRQGEYNLGVLVAVATLVYGAAYMVTHVVGDMRKRQREVLALKDSGLREKTKELEEANRELGKLEEGRKQLLRFLSIAAHDLKAPLAAVQSYLQLILRGFAGEVQEKQRHMLDRSSQRITEQLNLISDLLDISRIEAGQIVHEMEDVSLPKVVEGSLENVRSLAQDKKIELKVELPQSLPQIKASSVRLQQVLTNLLHNAVKFTPENGEIKLRAVVRQDDILVEVMDNGIGVSADDLPRIFDDFYRGSKTEKTGSGLGLSIAKRIIEAHGGQIWVVSPNPEDSSGRGSKFALTLPKSVILVAQEHE